MKILLLFTSFNIYLFIILAVIIGITGIIFLIIGISRKKVRVWVISIFVLLIALILGAGGIYLGVRKVLNGQDFNREKKYIHRWGGDNKPDSVDESFVDEIPEDSYTLEANAITVDVEGEAKMVQVLATKKLNKKGVFFESSDPLLEMQDLDDNFIYLNIRFDRSFRGYLRLKAFDKEKNGIARSRVEVDINDSLTLQLAFHFDDDFSDSDLSYCTLSAQKD